MKIHITQADTPRIYVGTYAKYNNGSIFGKWIDLTEFDDYDAFVARCRELHKDESDPEFMIQDFENFPEDWCCESGLPDEATFDKIRERAELLAELDEEERAAFIDFVDYEGDNDADLETFRDRFHGNMSEKDFAEEMAKDLGYFDIMEKAGLNAAYFDTEQFAHDLFIGDFYRTKDGNIFRRH